MIRRPAVGESLRILLGEADCDGALGVVEMTFPQAIPAHLCICPTHAEAFYVLAGDLSLQVGDEVIPRSRNVGVRTSTSPHVGQLEPAKGESSAHSRQEDSSDASSGYLPTNSMAT